MKTTLFATASLLVLVLGSMATPPKHDKQAGSSNQNADPFRTEEGALAALKKHFAKLDNLIPTLSPDEERWVRSEITATENHVATPRRMKLMQSEEYATLSARTFIQECKHAIDQMDLISNSERSAAEKRAGKAYMWAYLCRLLEVHGSSMKDSIRVLIDKKVLPSEGGSGYLDAGLVVGKDNNGAPYVFTVYQSWGTRIWESFAHQMLQDSTNKHMELIRDDVQRKRGVDKNK